MKPFIETKHCSSRAHCIACRSNKEWRASVKAPEKCPYGVRIDRSGNLKTARKGIGDIIESAAKPIAKALGMKCLDDKGMLKPESKCAKRRDWLNKVSRS